MANTYVVQSVQAINGTLIVSGTVNGVVVIVEVPVSQAGNNLASAIGFENFIAPLMLAAVPVSTTYPALTGLSFSQ